MATHTYRKKTVLMCGRFCSGLEFLYEDEYENFKKRVDDAIEMSWRNFESEMKFMENV
jgi:hypothetical protein